MPVESQFVRLRDGKDDFRPLDTFIGELAGRQHGVVARWQLLTMASKDAIDGRIARGGLHPIHRGVYAVGHLVLSVEARWMAAVLAAGPDAVLSYRSAGQLWGLLPRAHIQPEVTRPPGSSISRTGLTIHRYALCPDEVTVVNGIPTTSVFRTIFDLSAGFSMRRLEKAINETEVRGLTDAVSLPQLLDRYPGRRGAANLRALLAAKSPGGVTRNEFEERFLRLIDRHRLPRPRLNAHLAVEGRFFEVDCLWEEARLAVELDGRASHDTDLRFESDRERDRMLLVADWRPLRITWRQLVDEEAKVTSDLRALLRA